LGVCAIGRRRDGAPGNRDHHRDYSCSRCSKAIFISVTNATSVLISVEGARQVYTPHGSHH